MFTEFADDFEKIYGTGAVTLNVHLLRHYERMIRICGPLWCNALFGFESNIGVVKKYVCGTTDILQQITEKYVRSKTVINEISHKEIDIQEYLSQPKIIPLTDEYKNVLMEMNFKLDKNELIIYRRLKLNSHTYTSLLSNHFRSADFFVEMNNGTIGAVEFFFKQNNNSFLFLNKYQIDYTYSHIKEIKKMNKSEIHSCRNIKNKMLYLSVGQVSYICEELRDQHFV